VQRSRRLAWLFSSGCHLFRGQPSRFSGAARVQATAFRSLRPW
jgi:hypothetical protein